MKNRILWFLWLLCLAFAAVFTGSWIFAIILLLCGLLLVGSVLLSIFCGKKTKISLQFPKAAEQNEIFEGTLTVFNDSVLPVFMGSGNILWENSFTGESGYDTSLVLLCLSLFYIIRNLLLCTCITSVTVNRQCNMNTGSLSRPVTFNR